MGESPSDAENRATTTDSYDGERAECRPEAGNESGPAIRTGDAADPSGDVARPELRLTIVEYEDRPDRGTVHPAGITGTERMETWLSADASAFVDAATRR